MEQSEHILNILAGIAGIVAFAWIGLRADIKSFKDAVSRISTSPRDWRSYLSFLVVVGPYLLFCMTAVYLVWRASSITVKHHAIKSVQAFDKSGNSQPVVQLTTVELSSSDDHFEVGISGAIFGPELRDIRERYGSTSHVKVFAVVSEQTPLAAKQGLVWVQGNEFGTLDPIGNYFVKAYLGGTGVDSAKNGDVFLVRIYIPKKQNIDFANASVYDSVDALPAPLFLSEPIYIRCRRSAGANP